MNDQEKLTIEKALEIAKNKNKGKLKRYAKFIKIYIFPISAILIFFIIILGFVIPKVISIVSNVGEIDQLNSQLTLKQEELQQLIAMNNNKSNLESDLGSLDSLAPTGDTEVVGFQSNIANLAKSQNLTVSNQLLTENQIIESTLNINESLILREIPNVFEVLGEKDDIFSFIDELSALEDFIVIEQMELTVGTDQKWNMAINIIKYQFAESGDPAQIFQAYLQVPLTATMNQSVREFIESKN